MSFHPHRNQSYPSQSEPDIAGSDINTSRRFIPHQIMNPRKQPSGLLSDGSFLVIDKTQKSFIIWLWVSLAVVLILGLIIVGKMPQAYLKIAESQGYCPNPVIINHNNIYDCEDFDIKSNTKKGIAIKGLTNKNQVLILNAYFFYNDINNNTLVSEDVHLSQYKIDSNDKVQSKLMEKKFELNLDNYTITNKFLTNESQMLGVKGRLLYQHTIAANNVLFVVNFANTNKNPNIKNIDLQVLTINPQYTSYQKNIRTVFFVFSILSLIIYSIRKRNIAYSRVVVQHKLIHNLTIILIIFNNPLIAALNRNNKFLIFILQFSFCLLPVTLVFFWMCVFERGEKQNNQQKSKVSGNKHTWGIVILMFIFQFVMYLVDDYNHLVDYVGMEIELASFVGLRYTSFLITLCAYVIIIYRIVNVLMKQDSLMRYRRLIALSIIVIVLSLLFFLTVQYSVYSRQSKAVFLMVYLFNTYIYYLQFLYMKSQFNNLTQIPPISQNILAFPQPITIHEVQRAVVEQRQAQSVKSMMPRIDPISDQKGNQETKEEKNPETHFIMKELPENQIMGQNINDAIGQNEGDYQIKDARENQDMDEGEKYQIED